MHASNCINPHEEKSVSHPSFPFLFFPLYICSALQCLHATHFNALIALPHIAIDVP